MDELAKENIMIENMIYEIRGKQVMLDRDLAVLYQVETKRINEVVKRNKDRFPKDFYFVITKEEYLEFLRSQNATLKFNQGEHSKYSYKAFTEQGVAMLSAVLKSEIAVTTSVNIMRAFVSMRRYLSSNLILGNYLDNRILSSQVAKNTEDIAENQSKIALLQESFKKFEEKKIVNEIYYNGQIYDAYSKILDIFKEAKNEIIVIDGYADKILLDIIRNLDSNIKVQLITFSKNTTFQSLYVKYQRQYSNLKIKFNDTFHDRYIILDKDKVYHCGTSINHAGSKTFSINLLEDEDVKNGLIKRASRNNK